MGCVNTATAKRDPYTRQKRPIHTKEHPILLDSTMCCVKTATATHSPRLDQCLHCD